MDMTSMQITRDLPQVQYFRFFIYSYLDVHALEDVIHHLNCPLAVLWICCLHYADSHGGVVRFNSVRGTIDRLERFWVCSLWDSLCYQKPPVLSTSTIRRRPWPDHTRPSSSSIFGFF